MAINTGVNIAKEESLTLYAPPVGDILAKEESLTLYAPPVGTLIAKEITLILYGGFSGTPPVWTFTTMPNGILLNPYTFSWNLFPATPPTTYTRISGSLPTGLSLSSPSGDIGTINGTPTVLGTFSFTLRATNLFGTADQPFTITIVNPVVGSQGNFGWTN